MRTPRHIVIAVSFFIISLSAFHGFAEACSRGSRVNVSYTCTMADVIVRASAVNYAQPPRDARSRTSGVPDSKVEFEVEDVLKGDSVPTTIVLGGYLSDEDDFNDQAVPYTFVRPGGRAGSCYANTYRQGGQFLLFLKRTPDGFTPNFDPLAPVNEQLYSSADPWIYYVKGLLKGLSDTTRIKR